MSFENKKGPFKKLKKLRDLIDEQLEASNKPKKFYPKKINNEENILDVARKSKTVLKIKNTKQYICFSISRSLDISTKIKQVTYA